MRELPEGPPGLETTQLGRPLRLYDEVSSTNETLLQWADEGAVHGAACCADRQSEGRGRQGRRWWSPSGLGLYLSVLLRPELDHPVAPSIALVVGIAAARAVEKLAPLSVQLKWPNDLILNERKLGGILCESRGPKASKLVLGIGLNIREPQGGWPDELRHSAISLEEISAHRVERDDLLRVLLRELELGLAEFLRSGLEEFSEELRRRDFLEGRGVHYLSPSGARESGIAAGIDAKGQLVVRNEQGEERILAGEVDLAEAKA